MTPAKEAAEKDTPKQKSTRWSRSANKKLVCAVCPAEDPNNKFKNEQDLKKHEALSPEREKSYKRTPKRSITTKNTKRTPKRSIEDRYPDELNDSILKAFSSEKKRSRSRSGGRRAMASTQKQLGDELLKVDDTFSLLSCSSDESLSLFETGGWKQSECEDLESFMDIDKCAHSTFGAYERELGCLLLTTFGGKDNIY